MAQLDDTKGKLVPISGRISERDRERLNALAERHDRQVSWELRQAVRAYVEADGMEEAA
jgi:predicted transcriptional regulator